jgi:hypothetical protein
VCLQKAHCRQQCVHAGFERILSANCIVRASARLKRASRPKPSGESTAGSLWPPGKALSGVRLGDSARALSDGRPMACRPVPFQFGRGGGGEAESACAKNDSPERDGMLKAMKETERGWQRAMDKIAERASLTKSPNMRR